MVSKFKQNYISQLCALLVQPTDCPVSSLLVFISAAQDDQVETAAMK